MQWSTNMDFSKIHLYRDTFKSKTLYLVFLMNMAIIKVDTFKVSRMIWICPLVFSTKNEANKMSTFVVNTTLLSVWYKIIKLRIIYPLVWNKSQMNRFMLPWISQMVKLDLSFHDVHNDLSWLYYIRVHIWQLYFFEDSKLNGYGPFPNMKYFSRASDLTTQPEMVSQLNRFQLGLKVLELKKFC